MKILNKIILLAFISVNIFASGGSIYSRFWKGDLNNFYFARQMAIGGGGAALIANGSVLMYNPASISSTKLTRVETGFRSAGINLTTNSNSVFYSKTQFSGFAITLPIERSYGIAASIGILPVTTVNYAVKQHIVNSTVGDYDLTLEGNGGISKLFIGTSYRLPFNWIVGAQYEYYTGTIDYTSKLKFGILSGNQNAGFISSNKHHGMGATFGIISSDMSGIFNSKNISEFRIGAFINYFANLHTDSVLTSVFSTGSAEISNHSVVTKIPYKIGIGTSMKFNRILIMLDYLYQPWSQYEVAGVRTNSLNDYSRFSIGFEYKNSSRKRLSFWERISIRGGLSFENTQYRVNGENINQFALHTGVGLPITYTNNLDIGFMAGVRGVKTNNLIKEYFYRLSVTISFGQLWFVRQER